MTKMQKLMALRTAKSYVHMAQIMTERRLYEQAAQYRKKAQSIVNRIRLDLKVV